MSQTSAPTVETTDAEARKALPARADVEPPKQRKQAPKPVTVDPAPPVVSRLGPSTPGLDRNTARRLRQGRQEPDARIDLHGMTAEHAHRALTSFILSSHASGRRCVLVITGKGGRTRDDALEWRDRDATVGKLKTLTPHWLRTPPLSQAVVDVFQAHIRHGGDGALYVYLRKPRRR